MMPNHIMSYSLPYKQPNKSTNVSRDFQLQQDLKINQAKPKPAVISKVPLKIDHKQTRHPLDDLIIKSKLAIDNYELDLPADFQDDPLFTSPTKPIATRTRGTKRRNYDNIEEADYDDVNTSYFQANSSSVMNTPVRNKTIFFSPAGNKQATTKASTPLKEIQLNHKRSLIDITKGKLLKMDKAKIIKESTEDKENTQDDVDESDYDHLACHAHNILRMAVDSTMLGSTFNSSFSSVNDSILDKNNNILDEDLDKSVLEMVKSRKNNLLQKNLATKFEISADDLKNVLS